MFLKKRKQDVRVKPAFYTKKEVAVKTTEVVSEVEEIPEAPKKPAPNKRKTKKEEIQEIVTPVVEETVENNVIEENTDENGAN